MPKKNQKKTPNKTPNERAEACNRELQALLKKWGCQLNVQPIWAPDNTGGWRTMLDVKIVALPEA